MRRSVVAALAALVAAAAAVPAAGQAPPAQRAAKDPSQARVLSMLVPGLGHLYVGERARGATLLAVGVGGFAGLVADCEAHDCWVPPATGVGVAALLAYAGAWAYGVADADDAARRHNAAARRVGAYVAPTRAGARVGVTITLGGAHGR